MVALRVSERQSLRRVTDRQGEHRRHLDPEILDQAEELGHLARPIDPEMKVPVDLGQRFRIRTQSQCLSFKALLDLPDSGDLGVTHPLDGVLTGQTLKRCSNLEHFLKLVTCGGADLDGPVGIDLQASLRAQASDCVPNRHHAGAEFLRKGAQSELLRR